MLRSCQALEDFRAVVAVLVDGVQQGVEVAATAAVCRIEDGGGAEAVGGDAVAAVGSLAVAVEGQAHRPMDLAPAIRPAVPIVVANSSMRFIIPTSCS